MPNDHTDPLVLLRAIAPPSPVEEHQLVDGVTTLVKREDLGPNRTFKWRGALTACEAFRRDGAQGVVTASTGNHGAAVAWAAAQLNIEAHVVVPADAVEEKCRMITRHGATLHRNGPDLGAATAHAVLLSHERGLPLFEDGASAAQLLGTATVGRELLSVPRVAAIFLPVACGALAGGVATAIGRAADAPALIGVQSRHYSRLTALFHRRPYAPSGQTTIADGLADDRVVEPAARTCLRLLDDLIAVDDEQLLTAAASLAQAGIRAEGAGSAALAGLAHTSDAWRGRRVVVLVSGGNVSADVAREIDRRRTHH